jgi:hypothetical protein
MRDAELLCDSNGWLEEMTPRHPLHRPRRPRRHLAQARSLRSPRQHVTNADEDGPRARHSGHRHECRNLARG